MKKSDERRGTKIMRRGDASALYGKEGTEKKRSREDYPCKGIDVGVSVTTKGSCNHLVLPTGNHSRVKTLGEGAVDRMNTSMDVARYVVWRWGETKSTNNQRCKKEMRYIIRRKRVKSSNAQDQPTHYALHHMATG